VSWLVRRRPDFAEAEKVEVGSAFRTNGTA